MAEFAVRGGFVVLPMGEVGEAGLVSQLKSTFEAAQVATAAALQASEGVAALGLRVDALEKRPDPVVPDPVVPDPVVPDPVVPDPVVPDPVVLPMGHGPLTKVPPFAHTIAKSLGIQLPSEMSRVPFYSSLFGHDHVKSKGQGVGLDLPFLNFFDRQMFPSHDYASRTMDNYSPHIWQAGMVKHNGGNPCLAAIDIEHWPHDIRKVSDAVAQKTQRVLGQIAADVKAVRPDMKVGLYGEMPHRDYWASHNYFNALRVNALIAERGLTTYEMIEGMPVHWWRGQPAAMKIIYERWQAANTRATLSTALPDDPAGSAPPPSLADRVDVFFPSLYVFYEITDRIPDSYFQGSIGEARRVAGLSRNQPVVPWLWWHYHGSSSKPLLHADGTPVLNKDGKPTTVPISWRLPVAKWFECVHCCAKLGDALTSWGGNNTYDDYDWRLFIALLMGCGHFEEARRANDLRIQLFPVQSKGVVSHDPLGL